MNEQISAILSEIIASAPGDRENILSLHCGEDHELRSQVEALLAERKITFTQSNDQPWLGRQLGPYLIQKVLGKGGMSSVFAAKREDDAFGGTVALKMLTQWRDDSSFRRFDLERQILVQLNHPNIARLYDGGNTPEGFPYLVLEYVEGQALIEYCQDNELDLNQRLALLIPICRAVHYAHQNLVVHRDIKPANIMVTKDGTPKLLDFGIAKLIGHEHQKLTQTALSTPLTPRYASPEQIMVKPLTTASDIFSLGILAYELLTGVHPFAERGDIMSAICSQDPHKPSTVRLRQVNQRARLKPLSEPEDLKKQLKGDLDNIIMMALRKEPSARYHTAEQLADDIEAYLKGYPISARTASFSYVAKKFVQRHFYGVLTASTILLLTIGAAILFNQERITSNRLRMEAEALAIESELLRIRALEERDIAVNTTRFMEKMFQETGPLFVKDRGKQPTASVLLSQGTSLIAKTKLQGEPKALLLKAMGNAYFHLANYKDAIPLFKEALEIMMEVYGPNARQTNEVRIQYGKSLFQNRQSKESLIVLKEAERLAREHYTSDDPILVEFLGYLGIVYYFQGDHDKGIHYFETSVASMENNTKQHWMSLVSNYRYLGMSYARLRDIDQAWVYYEKGNQLLKTLGKQNTLAHATLLFFQSELSASAFLYDDAIARAKEVVSIQSNIQDNFDVEMQRLLAAMYLRAGEYAKAKKTLSPEIETDNDSIYRQGQLNQYKALIAMHEGRKQAAEALFLKSIEQVSTSFGEKSYTVADFRTDLIHFYLRNNQFDKAVIQAELSYKSMNHHFPEDSHNIFIPAITLAEAAIKEGDYAKAEKLFNRIQLGKKRLENRTFLKDLPMRGEWFYIRDKIEKIEQQLQQREQ